MGTSELDFWAGREQELTDPTAMLLYQMDGNGALCTGDLILDGRYCIERLLYQRPRLNLYLGWRVARHPAESEGSLAQEEYDALVAIRELVLTGLEDHTYASIQSIVYEEFVSPMVMGSPAQPTRSGHLLMDGDRCYLIMQLERFPRVEKKLAQSQTTIVTLADLLLDSPNGRWPSWLHRGITLDWGIQLCRIVARLHRGGVVLGDLDARILLVDSAGPTSWAPVLLPSWPPAPSFFLSSQASSGDSAAPPHNLADYGKRFPIASMSIHNAFVAPEMLNGSCDERSDVYSLGAILYLLCTHYAPVAAYHRLYAALVNNTCANADGDMLYDAFDEPVEYLELIPLHCLCDLSSALERVILRALALDPDERYQSAFALVEALETVEPEERARMRRRKKNILARVMGTMKPASRFLIWSLGC
jgi:hypothetical protein